MSKINEEKLVDSVLKAILGHDPHNPRGYVELQSRMAQQAIEGLIYGHVRKDDDLIEASLINLNLSINHAIDTRLEDSAFYETRGPSSDPEVD